MTAAVARGRRLTGETRRMLCEHLRDRYEDGASIRTLSGETGRSYGSVHRMLVESGVRLRGRGGGRPGGNTP